MSAPDLSPELKAFIFACIDTVEQAEALALLQASDPLSAQAVAERIGVTAAVARHHLEILAARGLLRITVEEEVRYRFAPNSDALRRYANELAETYRTSRMLVLRLIAQNSQGSLKSFLDAFRLRRKD